MNDLTPQLLRSLKDYSKEKLVKDLISGVIVAIIALPLSIAWRWPPAWRRSRGFIPPSWLGL